MGEGLALEGVTVGYGRVRVLEGLTLRAAPGQVTGLVGPNGSGKTTVVRVASRGLRPWSGTVRVGGRDPYRLSAREAARLVAVVPQELPAVFAFTALELVLMGRSPYRSAWGGGSAEDWAAARRAMDVARVHHLADRPFPELSGGERQRVILAQALAQEAPVMLLDEPTTHLDVRHVVEVLTVLRSLARDEGRTVLAVFHDLNLASAYCDRIHVLSGGRLVASGPPGAVLTASLLREVFGVEAEVTPSGTTGRPAVVVPPPLHPRPLAEPATVHVVGGAGRGAALFRALLERGFAVTAGVLHEGDTDAAAAERLNLLRVTVPPFSRVDRAAAEDCLELARRAALVVVCDVPVGPGNVENLRLALRAAAEGLPLLLVEQVPIEERDFTGGTATHLWRALRERAVVVGSPEEVGPAVERLRAGR